MTRFYFYDGFNEEKMPVKLTIDLSVVAAVHEFERTIYLEGESINWTLRKDGVDIDALLAAWMQARRGLA